MPGSRRPVSRMQATPPPVSAVLSKPINRVETLSSNPAEERDGNLSSSLSTPLNHAHIPDIPLDGNLLFEAMMFVYCAMCLALQYINLYKTVWWLPHSHANYALNFYLIDPYLVLFVAILTSRRLVWCFVKEVYGGKPGRSCIFWLVQLFKLTLVLGLTGAFGWTAYHVILRHSLLYSLFLCYPQVTYLMLFGFNMRPFFGKCLHISSSEKGTPRHKVREGGLAESVSHSCSSSPDTIREEADILKTDFNNRIKQVLFNSMLCAYYTGFVPLCFAQNTLFYDTWWVGQHVCLIWISGFVMYMVHFLPARYVDVLHRCALHLGHWVKVEGRNAHVPYNAWSELQVYQQGVLVKHVKGLFKAEGISNTAQPGNGMHSRFYFMFQHPLRVTHWLLVLAGGLVLYQLIQLVQAAEWSHILSLAFLLFCNYYVLFKLMRDRLLLSRAYKDEMTSMQQ